MNLSPPEWGALLVAVWAILMLGSTHLRLNIVLFGIQICILGLVTILFGLHRREPHLVAMGFALICAKGLMVPGFLLFIVRRVKVHRDTGTIIPIAISMHIAIGFLVVSYFLAKQLPGLPGDGSGWAGPTAAISLLCTGLMLMLTRRIALSQVIGFLVMEDGIYLFGLTQTKGMPMLIEMGILLDVLVGVMIAGLLAFRIKTSFEHIDVTMLSELRE